MTGSDRAHYGVRRTVVGPAAVATDRGGSGGRAFFDALVADNLDLGRPDQIELIFGRKILPSTTGIVAHSPGSSPAVLTSPSTPSTGTAGRSSTSGRYAVRAGPD